MRVNTNVMYPNFGRALTSKEKKSYALLVKDAKKEAGIKDTTAIVFDFNVPSEKGYNTGIGTTFSASMIPFISFVKDVTGISSVQVQPQGTITPSNRSPYSGTNYAYGTHIIDLKKLSTDEYANIIELSNIAYIDSVHSDVDAEEREYNTNYLEILGNGSDNGIQEVLLLEAYNNFINKCMQNDEKALKLDAEFSYFKDSNKEWLLKHSLYELLSSKVYQTSDVSKWSDIDRNLFSNSVSAKERKARIDELEQQFSNDFTYSCFKQFLADKQQKESREALNSQNIELYGDCLIGFSESERWANPDCFRENLYYGGPDPSCFETNGIQAWGLPALDYTKLGECSENGDLSKLGKVGKFLYDKYSLFFKRYDGIRMDAAWQFVTPFIYQSINGNYELFNLPEINYTIFNIMKAAAKNVLGDKFDEQNPDNIMLELVGMSAGKSREMTLNTYPHLYTTAYSEYDERPKKFIEKGYKNGKFYVGVGCHDNDSLVNMAWDTYKRDIHLNDMQQDYPHLNMVDFEYDVEEYKSLPDDAKIREKYRTAKFSEIFTIAKQFFTLTDMFGMADRINVSGKANDLNWKVRIPTDYEKFYFSQLSKGFGLNLPKSLANALRMQNSQNVGLIKKCDEVAEILRQEGPLTEEEANIAFEQGKIGNTFEYSI